MIAVVKIGGHQAIVQQGETLEVDKLDAEVGKTVKFETLLISEENGDKCQIGAPLLSATVEAKVVEHGRGKKIRVFKMKPRKRYRRTQGHRQDYTVVEITKIGAAAAAAKPVTKKTEAKAEKAAPSPSAKATADKEKPVAKKTTVTKKAPAKTAAKKVAKKA